MVPELSDLSPEEIKLIRIENEKKAVERDKWAEQLRLASEPILAELRAIGHDITDVWTLDGRWKDGRPITYWPEALPILMRHLELGGYPDRVMNGLARLMQSQNMPSEYSLAYWDRLKARYAHPGGPEEEDALAGTLSVIASRAQYDELVELVLDDSRGSQRAYFLAPIAKLGGPAGLELAKSLRTHPVLGEGAEALLTKQHGNRAKRYARARKQLAEAVAARPEPLLDTNAVEWSTSFDLPDWKKFATFLRKELGGELDGPLGKALFAAILAAPEHDEEHVPVNTRHGIARIGWFIDDTDVVDAYIFGPQHVHDLCETIFEREFPDQ